jgi:hypothetical protein
MTVSVTVNNHHGAVVVECRHRAIVVLIWWCLIGYDPDPLVSSFGLNNVYGLWLGFRHLVQCLATLGFGVDPGLTFFVCFCCLTTHQPIYTT